MLLFKKVDHPTLDSQAANHVNVLSGSSEQEWEYKKKWHVSPVTGVQIFRDRINWPEVDFNSEKLDMIIKVLNVKSMKKTRVWVETHSHQSWKKTSPSLKSEEYPIVFNPHLRDRTQPEKEGHHSIWWNRCISKVGSHYSSGQVNVTGLLNYMYLQESLIISAVEPLDGYAQIFFFPPTFQLDHVCLTARPQERERWHSGEQGSFLDLHFLGVMDPLIIFHVLRTCTSKHKQLK